MPSHILALILGAIWGALTLFSWIGFFTYRGRVKGAEDARDEAVKLSAEAMEIRRRTLEAYEVSKAEFLKHMNQPLVAGLTDEQVEDLGNKLASKLFQANAAVNLARVQ